MNTQVTPIQARSAGSQNLGVGKIPRGYIILGLALSSWAVLLCIYWLIKSFI